MKKEYINIKITEKDLIRLLTDNKKLNHIKDNILSYEKEGLKNDI